MYEIAEEKKFNNNNLKALCQMLQTKTNPHPRIECGHNLVSATQRIIRPSPSS